MSLLEFVLHEVDNHLGWVVHEDLGGSPQPFLHHACHSVQLVPWIDLKQADSIVLVSEAPQESMLTPWGNWLVCNLQGGGTGNKEHMVMSLKGNTQVQISPLSLSASLSPAIKHRDDAMAAPGVEGPHST